MIIKEIQAGYLTSFYFKNIYLYLVQNKLTSSDTTIGQVETKAGKYLLLDSLLFRIQNYHDKQNPLLCLPESCVDHFLDLYHN